MLWWRNVELFLVDDCWGRTLKSIIWARVLAETCERLRDCNDDNTSPYNSLRVRLLNQHIIEMRMHFVIALSYKVMHYSLRFSINNQALFRIISFYLRYSRISDMYWNMQSYYTVFSSHLFLFSCIIISINFLTQNRNNFSQCSN